MKWIQNDHTNQSTKIPKTTKNGAPKGKTQQTTQHLEAPWNYEFRAYVPTRFSSYKIRLYIWENIGVPKSFIDFNNWIEEGETLTRMKIKWSAREMRLVGLAYPCLYGYYILKTCPR
jgi:hypothetical protein